MGRPKKIPAPVRIEASYQPAPDRQLQQAIALLAAMYRDALASAARPDMEPVVEANQSAPSLVYKGD